MIRVLPESLVNKIAAGEVIVRPASVVKELAENAIDAGATRIEVEVGNECRDIRIRDDGCGIARGEAALALVRHATSKITEFDDLWALTTRGFRGEALASIAAVSRLQILTRRRGELAGTLVEVEGEAEPRISAAGCPEGTEVRVRDLFFNTPARLNFMKNAGAELNQVISVVMRQALVLPQIGFQVMKDGHSLLNAPPGQTWEDRVATLLGSGIRENLLAVDAERHDVRVRGFAVRPLVSAKNRSRQFYYVNRRPVSSKSLSFAVQEAYKGVIMVQRFPIVVLDITLPAGEVDVNVHPTKEEVRFRKEGLVNGCVNRAVEAALRAANLMPTVQFDGAPEPPGNQQDFLGIGGLPGGPAPVIPVDFGIFTGPSAGLGPAGGTLPSASPFPSAALAAQVAASNREFEAALDTSSTATDTGLDPEPAGSGCDVRPVVNSVRGLAEKPQDTATLHALLRGGRLPEPIGQVALCYIIAQTDHDLLLIDQHAAHERLLYLKFSDSRPEAPTQPLLIPVSVDVPAPAVAFMHRLLPVFAQAGLKVEHFGGQTFLVQAVPADLPNLDAAAVLADLLDDFETLGRGAEVGILRDRVITRMACRSAIKAGQRLHLDEMRALIGDIVASRLGFTCPHGRPTMVLLTRDQLDRQFKRKL